MPFRLPSIWGNTPTAANGTATVNNDDPSASKTLRGFRDQIKSGTAINLDTTTLSAVVDAIRHTDGIDDRKLLLEHALSFVSRLPPGPVENGLQNKIVELLYNDLGHPPATCIGNKYAWRTADGSFNNVSLPDLGKGNTPYARSVQQIHPLPKHELPDSGLIFDTLLKREKFVQHPAGLSSLMFSFAALVIHSVFRTSHNDVNVNETSSYVDLSPLYGHDQAAQDLVRDKKLGRGYLLPDVFAEDRMLLLPPAVCVLLVLFSRNHNHIAQKLLEINEKGTFSDPSQLDREQLMRQDEELFQTARLVNCGWFGSVVFSDYFSCILGLVRQGSSWSLNPFGEIRNADHSMFERGQGNICSVEFNCLYRWHATTSESDEKWVADLFEKTFDHKAPEDVTPDDFKAAAVKIKAQQPDISHWTFGNIQRQADGSFRDEDLANALYDATEHPAGAFGARSTPVSMRLHEMMGIEQNRRWGVCSLNDFRKFLGLKQYDSFLEWNSNPEVADAAEKLYGSIENLELYVGLQAEEAKPVVDGAGLCPGYTISRAILSDAIALTRGDRYFTHDYTPFNLTAWGFQDCQRDASGFGFGSTLGRLFLRTLPDSFTENSVYAFFPLMTPGAMKPHLNKLNVTDNYNFERPKARAQTQIVQSHSQVTAALKATDLVSPYAAKASKIMKVEGFYPVSSDDKERLRIIEAMQKSTPNIALFFHDKTRELMASHSYGLIGKNKTRILDLVRDVLKTVPVFFIAEIAGISLTTKTMDGQYTPEKLYEMLGDIYEFIFLEPDSAATMVLQARAQGYVKELLQHLKTHLTIGRPVSGLASMFSKPKKTEQHELVKQLRAISTSTDHLAHMILAIMVGGSVELSLMLTNSVNVYLNSDKQGQLCSSIKGKNAIEGYASEALRLDPPFQGVYRTSVKDVSLPGLNVPKNTRVFVDVAGAGFDGKVFPEPQTVNLTRPGENYVSGSVTSRCFGEATTLKIVGEVLSAVFEMPSIQRAPGQSGVLKRFNDSTRPDLRFAYLDQAKRSGPWPTSMAVQFESNL
ncbi:linoleate diol synthase [Mycena floridula]|nr:linoleate diol synthase [Mycena floridula]